MKEGGGNPIEALFADVPSKWRIRVMWISIGIVTFGAVMTLLWVIDGVRYRG